MAMRKTDLVPPSASPARLIPILVYAIAIVLFSGMDAAMKGLVLAVGVYNTVLWRTSLATAIAGAAWAVRGGAFPDRRALGLHAIRVVVVAGMMVFFFWGLARLPLAEAIALSFIAPLIALFLAAVLLGERIGRPAILASIAGLAGVAIIMAGQFGHDAYGAEAYLGTLSVLVSALFFAWNLILVRQLSLLTDPLEFAFIQNLGLAILFVIAAPWLGRMMPYELWPLLILTTILGLAGQFLMSWAYSRAEAQYLVPIEYTAFVWVILLGWWFFDEDVTWATLIGGLLIIAGCIYAARGKPKLAQPIEPASL